MKPTYLTGKKICKRCGKPILIDDKAVLLMTFKGDEGLEKVFFHWQCYLDWWDSCVKNKANQIIDESAHTALENAKIMMPGFIKQMSESFLLHNGEGG